MDCNRSERASERERQSECERQSERERYERERGCIERERATEREQASEWSANVSSISIVRSAIGTSVNAERIDERN
jgi:hypothetical protein